MQTNELKTNKTMRTGVILAVIAIITLIALAMTFAKYAVEGTGEDSARVAKWGLNTKIPTDLNLFDASYTTTGGTDSSVTVDASDGSNVIAPGTSKTTDITLASFTGDEAPEVMYHFEPSLTINNDGHGAALINKLDNLPGWHWVLGRNNEGTIQYKTSSQLIEAVKAYQQKDIAPNTMPDTKTIQLGWVWEFDNSSAAGTWDASDTELGNYIAAGNLSSLKVTLTLNAYQCQGCSSKADPNLQTTAPDNLELEIDDASSFSASTDSDGVMSITSDNSSIASVAVTNINGSSKNFSIRGVSYGNTTVTINVPATSTYSGAKKIINVTVNKIGVVVPTAKENLVYNGSEQIGVVNDASDKYSLTGNTATNAGNYNATASLFNPSKYIWNKETPTSVDQNISWKIAAKSIADCSVSIPDQSYIYTGQEIKPEVTVKDGATTLVKDTDYTVSYSDNINAGTAKVTVIGTGNYGNNTEKEFTIYKAKNPMTFPDQSDTSSIASDQSVAYTFKDASGAPEGSSVSYDASSSASDPGNFYIPDHSKNVLVCAENTGADTYTIDITATAPETANYEEGCVTKSFTWTVEENISYMPIQYAVGDQSVNFLPAVSDASWAEYDLKFYEKTGDDNYTQLNCSSMSSLATAINNLSGTTATEKASRVYTSTTGVTFYGTLVRYWNDTFVHPSTYPNTATDLSESMKTLLKDGTEEYVYKTVYGDYVDGNWTIDPSNFWDASGITTTAYEPIPKLGTTGDYTSFRDAYYFGETDNRSLLCKYAGRPLSSKVQGSTAAWTWNCQDSAKPNYCWTTRPTYGSYSCVVLRKDF